MKNMQMSGILRIGGKLAFALCCLFPCQRAVGDVADDIFASGDRVIFLGDSNTYAGTYISFLDAFAREYAADMDFEFINVGLGSETTCGLSEPSHPWPRPDVRERLDRVLEKMKPDVVFVCYGMNDAIYHPFDQTRFEAFQHGLTDSIERVKASGAKIILMTPPPFDPLPMKRTAKLKPIDAGNFAWDGIYEEYDEVIGRYAKWVLTQSENVDLVIDLHSAMNEELNKRRDADPDFSYSNDGVHFNAAGHRVVAGAILTALELEPKLTDDTDYLKQVSERQTILRDAWLEHCGHLRPGVPKGLPFKEALDKAKWIDANLRNGTTAAIP